MRRQKILVLLQGFMLAPCPSSCGRLHVGSIICAPGQAHPASLSVGCGGLLPPLFADLRKLASYFWGFMNHGLSQVLPSPIPSESGRAVVLIILLLCQGQNPVAPRSPAGFCFGRGIRRDHRVGMTASSHTRSRHEHPDRRVGASRSLPSKDTGRGASPPWP